MIVQVVCVFPINQSVLQFTFLDSELDEGPTEGVLEIPAPEPDDSESDN